MQKRGWAILAGALTAVAVLVAGMWFGVNTLSAQEPETARPWSRPGEKLCDGDCTDRQALRQAAMAGWQARGQVDLIAETLGMTTDDLVAALREGQSVADVAAQQGVALETLVEALLAPRRDALAEKVADGTITQERADEMLTRMREQITTRLQQTRQPGQMLERGMSGLEGNGGMRGGRGMRGGGMVGGRGGCNGVTQP